MYGCTYSEYSIQQNASRIKYLQAQDEVVNSMKEAASEALVRISNNKKAYRKLLKSLIVQVLTYVTKFYMHACMKLRLIREN